MTSPERRATSEATPAIDALLAELRGRLRRGVWLHGTGRALTFAGLWLAFAFLADWMMHVPAGVRLVHLAVLIALPIFVLRRELWQRLRRVPDADGLAVLVERAHPELHELLVSGVQLARARGADGADPELVRRVVAQAEARARSLDLAGVFEPRPARVSFALGGACVLACALLLAADRDAAAIFLARIAGGSTPWPQRTRLTIEVPVAGGRARVEEVEGELRVRVARGSDVSVVVRAEGVVPDDVTIHFEGGHVSSVPAAGDASFRTLLRALQEDVAFHVTGGDDDDGLPRVAITVLQPPDVAGIALVIEPPAYSGLPARTERDRDASVLAGSRIGVHVQPDPPDAHGVARLLPADRVVPLEPRPFPRIENQAGEPPADGAAALEPTPGLYFELVADLDLRYRFELEDETGLANPDPGLFAIQVIADRPPEVELLSPGRAEVETVLGGALPLRVRAFDDFGLTALELSLDAPGIEGGASAGGAGVEGLAWRPVEPGEGAGPAMKVAGYAARLLEVDQLAGGVPPVEGQLFSLEVAARDNREPEPLEGRSPPLRVRVVSADEMLRRIQDRLSRARTDVSTLAELVQEKQTRTNELVASLESNELHSETDSSGIGAVSSGMRRAQGDARALARELASVAESLLYSRLDDRAGALLLELDALLSAITDRGFHPEPWVELWRLEQAGQAGQALFAGKLVAIVGIALEISEIDAPAAVEAIRRAQEASDIALAHEALLEAVEIEARALAKTDRLLELLAEWDNFQSVLSLTRDILNRQKNLLERTRQYAKEN